MTEGLERGLVASLTPKELVQMFDKDKSMDSPTPSYPTKHNLAADLADRIPGMNLDSKMNNATVIESLVDPVYRALQEAQLEITMLKSQRDHLTRMEEEQRMLANQFREQLSESGELVAELRESLKEAIP